MTTFILHGGATSKNVPSNDAFFAHFTALTDADEVKILLCYWAMGRETWNELSTRDIAKIKKATQKTVHARVVADVPELFSLIDDYDVLYVAGVDSDLLEPYYADLAALKKRLVGKVYIGSSMGAFLASKAYVLSFESQHSDVKRQGIGLVPLQMLCH